LALVQRVFGFSKVSFEGFDLLLSHGVLMFKLSDILRCLTLLVGSLILDHLDVLLVALLLFADLLLIVLNGSVVTFLSTLTLFLETALESVTLNLKESLKLIKLFFRFLLHLSKRLLKLTSLVLKLVLELLVSRLCAVLALLNQTRFLRLKDLNLVEGAVLNVLRGCKLLTKSGSLVQRVFKLLLKCQLHLRVTLLERVDLVCEAFTNDIEFGFKVLVLL